MEFAVYGVIFCALLWLGWQDGKAGPLYMLAGFQGLPSIGFLFYGRWTDASVCIALAAGLGIAGLVRERIVGER